MPMVNKLDKRLDGISSMLSYTGRLTLLNSVITSLPMYAMCTIKVPVTILVYFEKSGRQFLWSGKEIHKQGKCLANWKLVCRPKDQGGLGVINLRVQNQALLMKNLLKFYNHYDIPWVNLIFQAYYNNSNVPHATPNKGSFWWKDCMAHIDDYRGMVSCIIVNGKTILLWKGIWNGFTKEIKYPHLHSANNANISME